MKKSLLLILFHIGVVFTVFSQSIRDTVSMHYVPYGIVKLDSVIKNDIMYSYHSDTSGRYYISTSDKNFTNSNMNIGSEFHKIKNLGSLKITWAGAIIWNYLLVGKLIYVWINQKLIVQK
ncbi:hypothetical protein [Sphingobacterium bovisgrunnientis]|uniref:hypothetical protein n=1 Tax=Sphingobacterium bovisgrunnientis TaxID=1874697 RepID=UPI001359F19E|nr:hypothetical protein [Sphingobacterium bovisgrunnientis]